jgi:hypothetical protein
LNQLFCFFYQFLHIFFRCIVVITHSLLFRSSCSFFLWLFFTHLFILNIIII